ncbi:hypothetical protein [Mesorhizobium sp. LNHC221B00]|uniref:hypothetical protein n=1 Tax=Mesorhizobium sp. LNHC221B00 TaxID=1287233 RepID=UPI0012EB473B|nr:hypothetical protein [Mesorhizobium sp. LNHC221B00]
MQKRARFAIRKGDIDVNMGAAVSVPLNVGFATGQQIRESLSNKAFLLWHGLCAEFCECINETSSMIMRTENAVAAVKPRSRLLSSRRKAGAPCLRRAIAPASSSLIDLESVSRDGAGIQVGGKDIQ